jgi:hypothetical protein
MPPPLENTQQETSDLVNELNGLLGTEPIASAASTRPIASEIGQSAGIVIRERAVQLGSYVDHSFSKLLTPTIVVVVWYLTLLAAVALIAFQAYSFINSVSELPPKLWLEPLKWYGGAVAAELFVVLNIRLWLELCVHGHRISATLRSR